ncbi:MAG: hypothetical protein GY903_12560 [Fuerstiella sp.]|nr:hypothetical protein [Fuerstiella sp.]MCP4855315.1 hypothetical protein [Fuerstiella sp.]
MKKKTEHQQKHRRALSCLTAMALLSLPAALKTAEDPKPDSPESVAALKAIGAVLEQAGNAHSETDGYFRVRSGASDNGIAGL